MNVNRDILKLFDDNVKNFMEKIKELAAKCKRAKDNCILRLFLCVPLCNFVAK